MTIKQAFIAFVNSQTAYKAYLEANGNDGSEQYQSLLTARDDAAASYESALTALIQATN